MILAGAAGQSKRDEFGGHWAFQPIRRPDVPAGTSPHPIDRFVHARLKREGLAPSPEAGRWTLVRRIHLDLLGLPPSPGAVESFARDETPDAYERLVDRLLQSPHHAECMAQDWLDRARYADTTGHAADMPRTMWLYRDWVIKAYRDNMPFDRFTVEQLAGDMLPEATADQKIATGFNRNAIQALGNNPRKEEFRVKGIVDRLDTTGRVWMGLTVGCAECHDHPHDPVRQKEYYGLFAIFNNVPHYGEKFGVHGPRIKAVSPLAGIEKRVKDAEWAKRLLRVTDPPPVGRWAMERPSGKGAIEAPVDDRFDITGDLTITAWIETRSAVADIASKYDWQHGMRSYVFGIGGEADKKARSGALFAWVSAKAASFQGVELYGSIPVNDGRRHHVAFVFRAGKSAALYVDGRRDGGATSHGKVPARIAVSPRPLLIGAGYGKDPGARAHQFVGLLQDVRIYPRALAIFTEADEADRLRRPADAQVMDELEKSRETFVHVRGNPEVRGPRVAPGVPAFLPPIPDGGAVNRRSFAEWLVSESHPLTARVAVNRIWQHHFGIGLVETSGDFGTKGGLPSHPALLDWLAAEFVRSGWDVKAMRRLIVTSATYRQSSAAGAEAWRADPKNRRLARGPRHRLPAEQIRDLALSVSGLLDRRVGGPSVYPAQPPGVGKFRDKTAGSWKTSAGGDRYRRSIYTFWQRMSHYPSLATLDAPSRERCVLRRSITNTPLQALVTLNDPVFVEAARGLARRVLEAGPDRRIDRAFMICLSRPPTNAERGRFEEFLRGRRDELTAWTMAGAVLLNLDETITLE